MIRNHLGKKGLVLGIIFLFVGTCVIPSSAQNIEKPSLTTSISIHKIFFLGTLINYSINETNFYLESHNLRIFEFLYSGNQWGFSYYHYRGVIFGMESGKIDFHGILRPHFICGILS